MEKTFAVRVSADALEADFRIFNLITGVFRTARERLTDFHSRDTEKASVNDLLAIGLNILTMSHTAGLQTKKVFGKLGCRLDKLAVGNVRYQLDLFNQNQAP